MKAPGDDKVKQFNILLFVILFQLFFLLILYKVFNVPITHDEVLTAVRYPKFTYWQLMMFPEVWPNNHILNSMATKFFISLFGYDQWVIRLANLLAFVVYGYAVFRINRTVFTTSSVFFIPASILFLCNLYLLDFFGLSRGYGLASAFSALSVSFLITGYKDYRPRDIWLSFFLAIAASYANFTVLPYWAACTLFAWFYFFISYRKKRTAWIVPTIALVVFSVLYGLLIAGPVMKMHGADVFRDWHTTGFFKDTVVEGVRNIVYNSTRFQPHLLRIIGAFIVMAVLGNVIYGLVCFVRNKFDLDTLRQPLFIAGAVLLVTVLANILQCTLFKTPYLTGRTALFLFPLFIISLVTALGLYHTGTNRIPKIMVSAIVGFLLLFQIAGTMKLNYVKEWWFDAKTVEMIDFMNKTIGSDTVTLKANWLLHPSIYYYRFLGKMPNIILKDYDQKIDTNTRADYYYILKEDYGILESRFRPVLLLDNQFLLVRRREGPK